MSVVASRGLRPGAPPGMPDAALSVVGHRADAASVTSVRHRHLSGWKTSGAYQVVLGQGGNEWSVIFKDAQYGAAHRHALEGLPLFPGAPEALVCAASEELATWVPRCWWSDAEPPGRYRYLLEDLSVGYTRTVPGARRRMARMLPHLHHDLESTLRDHPDLLDHDAVRDAAVQFGVHGAARLVEATGGGDVIAELAAAEPLLRSVLSQVGERLAGVPTTVVHGDLNPANVLWHRSGDGRVRLLDWEWAGAGLAHHDLASLLKHATWRTEVVVVLEYARVQRGVPVHTHLAAYGWCKLQRGLVDTGFFARQMLGGETVGDFAISRHVDAAAQRTLDAVRWLRRLGVRP